MTQLDKDILRVSLAKAALSTFEEFKFRKRVLKLCMADLQDACERCKILANAIDDIDNFDFDKEVQ